MTSILFISVTDIRKFPEILPIRHFLQSNYDILVTNAVICILAGALPAIILFLIPLTKGEEVCT